MNPGVAQPPVAAASATPTSPGDVTAIFTGSGSYDPNGRIIASSWNFGDGTALDPGTNPSHVYSARALTRSC